MKRDHNPRGACMGLTKTPDMQFSAEREENFAAGAKLFWFCYGIADWVAYLVFFLLFSSYVFPINQEDGLVAQWMPSFSRRHQSHNDLQRQA